MSDVESAQLNTGSSRLESEARDAEKRSRFLLRRDVSDLV